MTCAERKPDDADVSSTTLRNRVAAAKPDLSDTPSQINEVDYRNRAAIHAPMSAQDERLIAKIVLEDRELLQELAKRRAVRICRLGECGIAGLALRASNPRIGK